MPSEYSSEHSKEDAEKLAKNLGIQYTCIPIQKLFDSYKLELKDSFKGYSEDGTEENLQARIRGTILMALSNKFRYLLLATGNKSELAVGYCTLYGDMCGGFCVLSDVYKTKVYELAAYINRQKELIPKNSITKPPSAELRPNQLDQDSLPPYELLDALLKAYIEEDKSKDEIAELHPDIKIVEDIIYKVNRAEFKRKQAAPGIKLTEKAFGTGRQMPIVNRYAG
jgi:NAD+ synthetase